MERALGSVMAGLALACASGPTAERPIELAACRLEGLAVEARCGTLRVFEDRDEKSGRTIDLRVAVVPALASSPRPDPLFVLVGGPGQAATEAGARIAERLRDVLRQRDVVLVDQRGTGHSNPLDCESDRGQPLEELFSPHPDRERTRACHAALDADTRLYATPPAMDDLDDVRAALGYERINLWGGSYGTRAALVYARQHPEHVRSLILDGSAPFALSLPLYVARDAQRALDLLYDDCERDADCQRAFPGARQHLQALLDRLDGAAAETSLAHPRTGAPLALRISRAGLASSVRTLLYLPELAGLLPLAVERALEGDYGAFVASADAFSRGVSVSTGMFLSIVCAEDVPRFDARQVDAATGGTFLGGKWLAEMRDECADWPAAQLPEAYFAPVTSDVPSLLLSGNLDPVTPPSWGELVASNLPRSRHIVVPGAGHGTTSLGCIPELLAEFLEHLDPTGLDAGCVGRLARPPVLHQPPGAEPVIVLEGLVKRYGTLTAVDGVSLRAENGKVTGLLGPNGAGKTTTLRMLSSLVRPDAGRALVDGVDVAQDPHAALSRLGILPDGRGLYPRLTAREHLEYFGGLHGLAPAVLATRVEHLVDLLDMGAIIDRRVVGFSQGERTKVAIARALVHDPANVVLDEATNGLDVMSTRAMRRVVRELAARGSCVLFSSHVMQEVSALCDQIIVFASGRVVAQGSPEALREATGEPNLEDAFMKIIGTGVGLS